MKTLPRNVILAGDARERLAGLLPESVDCCVTSPPYVSLRDYGHPDQLGREPDVIAYVKSLRAILCQVRRVLKPTGSLWLNLGDTTARHPRQGAPRGSLLLMPQRVALALLEDDWLVRSVVIWHKRNPMPQSARDRLSPTYEVVIHATKSRRYLFDLNAIRAPHRSLQRVGRPSARSLGQRYQGNNTGLGRLRAIGEVGNPRGKNPGDLWTLPTAIDRLGHQATFPEALAERPILATCPERICVQCDAAWTRPTRIVRRRTAEGLIQLRQVGRLRRCGCFAPSRPGVVLDPFFGTGTVGVVARRHRRDWLGVELNPRFAALARTRLGEAL